MMMNELTIGPHRVHVDRDAVLTRWIGVPEYEDVRTIHLQFEQVFAKYGRLFVINDMRQSGIPSTQTRKWIADWTLKYQANVTVLNFGASFAIRALQHMIFRALALIGKNGPVEVIQCTSEAEAIAWIETRRRQLA